MWTIEHHQDKAMQRHFSRASDGYNPQYKNDKFIKESLQTHQIQINPLSSSPTSPPSPPPLGRRIQTTTGSVSVVKESNYCGKKYYWKVNFFFVLLPFVLCGVPIHALLFHKEKRVEFANNEDEEKEKRRHYRRRKSRGGGKSDGISYWFKTLFTSSCLTSLFSIFLIPFALLTNLGPIYFFCASFNSLVILGQIDEDLAPNIINLFLYLPFLIIVDYVWIFGYSLERLLHSFSSLSLWRAGSSGSSGGGQQNKAIQLASTGPSCRMKMIVMYFLVGGIHIIHFFIIDHRAKEEGWDREKILEHWINYATTIFYSLMLPVYASFCWAIVFQFGILTNFIDVLILRRDELKMEYLALFKTSYKIIADSIIQINKLFSILFSWVLLALALTLMAEAQDAALYFFRLLTSSPKVQQHQVTVATNDEGTAATTVMGFVLTPELVRSFVGQVVTLILYAILVIFTIWQAVQANDEARYFHVWLNDFASEQTDDVGGGWRNQSNNKALALTTGLVNTQIYQAFRQLKFYVHSRMEQEKPALLNITILVLIPPLQRRLVNYQVRH